MDDGCGEDKAPSGQPPKALASLRHPLIPPPPMRFSDDFLRALRDRVSIAGYAGRRLQWDQRKSQPAKGDFWACCPFHHEKSASFHVLEDRGLYNCFGCGEKGDVVSLAMRLDGLSFPEAVERLAAEAGMALPAQSPAEEEGAQARRRLFKVLADAAAIFTETLNGPRGRDARAYLEKRGLDLEARTRFGLGFAPEDWSFLTDRLIAAGAQKADLEAAGLAKKSDRGGLIDVFRGRVIFPITDAQERVIAFGGRALDPGNPAKYLNSPKTALYDKGQTLFRLAAAKRRLAETKGEGLIVAEGYMDVIALERAGLPAVAPCGTSLTEGHLALLWKAGRAPVLCFDGDAAGKKAAGRALDLAMAQFGPARTLRTVFLPPGQDPDDVFRKEGPERLAALLAAPIPAVEALFEREREEADLATPEGIAAFKARLRQAAARITDSDTAREYDRVLKDKAFALLAERRKRPDRPPFEPRAKGKGFGKPAEATPGEALKQRAAAQIAGGARGPSPVEAALRRALEEPGLLERGADLLAELRIEDRELDGIRHALLDLHLNGEAVDRKTLCAHLLQSGERGASSRVSGWPAPKAVPPAELAAQPDVEAEWRQLLQHLQCEPGIRAEFREARARLREEEDGSLSEEIRRVQELGRALRRDAKTVR